MKVEIASTLLAELLESVARSPDHEVCGLLFGTPVQILAHQSTPNVATDRTRTFEIDPATLLAAHRRGREHGPALIGHYHSHPTGKAEPSAADAARADEQGSLWLIMTAAGVHGLFRAESGGPIHGRFAPCELQAV